jgi:hypothetical protein
MLVPRRPSSAGIRPTATRTLAKTTRAPATPRLATKGMPTAKRPSRAIMTIVPANITARPAVSTA